MYMNALKTGVTYASVAAIPITANAQAPQASDRWQLGTHLRHQRTP